jgi:hypothetical protein
MPAGDFAVQMTRKLEVAAAGISVVLMGSIALGQIRKHPHSIVTCVRGRELRKQRRLGNYACISDGQVGSGYPTVTQLVTHISTDYLTETQTESVTVFQTVVPTQQETDVQTVIQTQAVTSLDTVVQSITFLQTVVTTTTNNLGQAVTQTLTVSSVSVAAGAGQTGCSTGDVVSNHKSNNTDAI